MSQTVRQQRKHQLRLQRKEKKHLQRKHRQRRHLQKRHQRKKHLQKKHQRKEKKPRQLKKEQSRQLRAVVLPRRQRSEATSRLERLQQRCRAGRQLEVVRRGVPTRHAPAARPRDRQASQLVEERHRRQLLMEKTRTTAS